MTRPSALAPRTLADLRRRLEQPDPPVPTARRVTPRTSRGPRTITAELWESEGLVGVVLSCGHEHTLTRNTIIARQGRVYCPACVRAEQ